MSWPPWCLEHRGPFLFGWSCPDLELPGGWKSHRITVLWTVPRSVSTSFERMMIERGDHTVFDEPFSRGYYYGPERRSDRFTESLPASSDSELLDMLETAATERPVFVKDMAYHALGVLTPDVLGRFQNCFLVREPAIVMRSLARHWPDFTDEEAGWDALGRAADIVVRSDNRSSWSTPPSSASTPEVS